MVVQGRLKSVHSTHKFVDSSPDLMFPTSLPKPWLPAHNSLIHYTALPLCVSPWSSPKGTLLCATASQAGAGRLQQLLLIGAAQAKHLYRLQQSTRPVPLPQ